MGINMSSTPLLPMEHHYIGISPLIRTLMGFKPFLSPIYLSTVYCIYI